MPSDSQIHELGNLLRGPTFEDREREAQFRRCWEAIENYKSVETIAAIKKITRAHLKFCKVVKDTLFQQAYLVFEDDGSLDSMDQDPEFDYRFTFERMVQTIQEYEVMLQNDTSLNDTYGSLEVTIQQPDNRLVRDSSEAERDGDMLKW